MKNRMFVGTSILKAFWLDFGKDLGGFWESKIINFRTFSHVFWKQISNNVLEAKKIEKNGSKTTMGHHLGWDLRNVRPAGERKREGSEAS